jgi:hypothetical protein
MYKLAAEKTAGQSLGSASKFVFLCLKNELVGIICGLMLEGKVEAL